MSTSSTLSRAQVIAESLRHLNRQPHLNRDLCVYCCEEEERMPPNPWHPEDVVIRTAAHVTHRQRKDPHCALCNPDLNKVRPLHGLYQD